MRACSQMAEREKSRCKASKGEKVKTCHLKTNTQRVIRNTRQVVEKRTFRLSERHESSNSFGFALAVPSIHHTECSPNNGEMASAGGAIHHIFVQIIPKVCCFPQLFVPLQRQIGKSNIEVKQCILD